MSDALKIGLIGAGHLGGSFALALREAGEAIHITAYDVNPSHAERLLARGAVDTVATSITEAVKGVDLVMLATPVRSYRVIAKAMAPALTPGTIVTDLGSVKQTMESLAPLLPGALIVPGHPIAGSELSGPDAARADLFENRLCILTPTEDTDAEALGAVEGLWQVAGADVIAMPAPVHDQIYAYVSHLPHYIAFIAAAHFHAQGITINDGDIVLQQFLRISRSNPRMWTDVALENRQALLPVLGTYIALLEHFATELRAGGKSESTDPRAVAKAFLPRILAASLISAVSLYEQQSGSSLRPFGAGGMRDIVAPAAISPEEDTEAMSHSASQLADALDAILPRFRTLEQHLGAEDEPALYAYISSMVEDAELLNARRN